MKEASGPVTPQEKHGEEQKDIPYIPSNISRKLADIGRFSHQKDINSPIILAQKACDKESDQIPVSPLRGVNVFEEAVEKPHYGKEQ